MEDENNEVTNPPESQENDPRQSLTLPVSNESHSSTSISDKSEVVDGASVKTEMRRAIQYIMRDKLISEFDRRKKIQTLMDGSSKVTNDSSTSLSTTTISRTPPKSIINNNSSINIANPCVHYERKCNIVAPCCHIVYGCRLCHDEQTPHPGHGQMDRFAIKEVVCKECGTRQPKSNKCEKCDIQFSDYYCSICNLWMETTNKPFHCSDCGFCRVGGKESFKHCHECCMCVNNANEDHTCRKDKYKNSCPVCREDMFTSRSSAQDLPCGHIIHSHCFRRLAEFDYRCPICKKTITSRENMARVWEERARDIEMQPMPEDLARKVNIYCSDCERKSEDLKWHFLGVQCAHCNSFNTIVEK